MDSEGREDSEGRKVVMERRRCEYTHTYIYTYTYTYIYVYTYNDVG
jgi:hypothetical protein